LFFFVLITGVLVIGFSGCTNEEKEDLTDWAIPLFEKTESQSVTYVVKKGDSISVIAEQHGISPLRLADANGLRLEGSKSIIYPGQKLIIPVD
jgi:LysM repeat protein